jgi:glucan phosphoethanolaminetransferase (alkaline phosphatase superfamily)
LIPNFETENFFSAIFLKKELFEGLFIFACFLFFSFLLLLLLFLFNFSFRTFFFLFFLCFFCYLFYNSQIFVTETFFFFFYVAEPDAWLHYLECNQNTGSQHFIVKILLTKQTKILKF